MPRARVSILLVADVVPAHCTVLRTAAFTHTLLLTANSFTESEDEEERKRKIAIVRSALIEGLPQPSITGASPVPTILVREIENLPRLSSKLDLKGFGVSSNTLPVPGLSLPGRVRELNSTCWMIYSC